MFRFFVVFLFCPLFCYSMVINGMVDVILREMVRKMPNNTITLPDFTRNMTGGLKLRAREGWLGMLSTLKRTGNAVIESDKDYTDIQLHVGLSIMDFGFKSYSLSAGNVNILSGKLNGSIAENSLYMRISLKHPENSPCEVKVQEVELKEIEGVKVKLTGMGVLNSMYSKLVSWTVNKYLDSIKETISFQMESVFRTIILKQDICGITRGYQNQ